MWNNSSVYFSKQRYVFHGDIKEIDLKTAYLVLRWTTKIHIN